jgi:alpha,alpha-trehalose phosphorylase
VAALFVRGDRFTAEEKARDFSYYEAICVRDSSLSACIQGVVAAEVGHLELAYDYFGEAARVDLDDLAHNTKDGLHIASLAGSWLVAVCGFGGLRDHDGELCFAPRLPPAITRLAFAIGWRGRRLRVDITPGRVRYELIGDGESLQLRHEGETLLVDPGEAQEREWRVPDPGPAPRQPHGRAPHRRTPT